MLYRQVASEGRDPGTVDSVHNYDQAISKSSQQQKQKRTEETSKGVTHDDGPALKQRKNEKRLRRKSSLNKNDDSVVPHSRKRMESVGFDISDGADEILLVENKRDSCRRCSKVRTSRFYSFCYDFVIYCAEARRAEALSVIFAKLLAPIIAVF